MSTVYGSTEKLYPSLPSAPQPDESHIYRLKKIEEIEAFLQKEILERERLYKKIKRYATATKIVEMFLVIVICIIGSSNITALKTGFGTSVSIALTSVSAALTLPSGHIMVKRR